MGWRISCILGTSLWDCRRIMSTGGDWSMGCIGLLGDKRRWKQGKILRIGLLQECDLLDCTRRSPQDRKYIRWPILTPYTAYRWHHT